MANVSKNEEFLKRLLKSTKVKAKKILKSSTEDELNTIGEIFFNARLHLTTEEIKKCRGNKFIDLMDPWETKKLAKITRRKHIITNILKHFKCFVSLVTCILIKLYEAGLIDIYMA